MSAFLTIFRFIPLIFIHFFGYVLGILIFIFSKTYRQHLCENLNLINEKRWIMRLRVAGNAGCQVVEMLKLWSLSSEEIFDKKKYIKAKNVVNSEILHHALQHKKNGILFITPHLGCFEITAQYFAYYFGNIKNITVLYRKAKNENLQNFILQGRQREHLHLASADLSGVKKILSSLKKAHAVGILPDQVPKSGEGEWLEFFGKPAYTMVLAGKLSQIKNVHIIFAYAERLSFGRGYRLYFSKPSDKELKGDILERSQQINKYLEKLIKQCPQQYLWGYNRFKKP